MHLADGRHHGIHLAYRLEQLADRAGLLDVDLRVAALRSGLHDLMAFREGGGDEPADGAGRADDEDLHVRCSYCGMSSNCLRRIAVARYPSKPRSLPSWR